MTSAPTKTVTTTTITGSKKVSISKTTSGNSTTITKTTTIGTPKKVASSGGSKASGPVKAAGALAESRWITGPNDDGWTMCGPVAIANSLLISTGTEATNGDIERLYKAAGGIGDSGAPLESFLAAAAATGLAGCRLASYERTEPADADLLLLAVTIRLIDGPLTELHAAAVSDGDAIMWGAGVPLGDLNATVLDAWSLTWHGEVAK